MATPLIAKELQASFRRALSDARARRHELLTLEHLLLALTQDLKTREILSACGANVERLRQRLETCLAERLERLPEGVNAEPQQTIGIERVLQRAAISALTAEQRLIEGGDVLVAMFREHDSDALSLLQQEGITQVDLLSYLSHGLSKRPEGDRGGETAGADASGADGSGVMTQARLSPDVWEALGHYRDERARQFERNVAIGEALNEILQEGVRAPFAGPPRADIAHRLPPT